MSRIFSWWYSVALPRHEPDMTPAQRERTRYERLTSGFALLLLLLNVLSAPASFYHPYNITSEINAVISLVLIVLAVVFGRLGWQALSAVFVVLPSVFQVFATMFTNPLDPSSLPILGVLILPVILVGALLPPISSVITAVICSILIIVMAVVQPHTKAYDNLANMGSLTFVDIGLPIIILVVSSLVMYVIMRNLISSIKRADRAEEIISLQKEIADRERVRVQQQQQLEDGIGVIAQVHIDVANGNLDARVPLSSDNVLWQVAVPLNNLLSRLQHWKVNSDQLESTQIVINGVVHDLQIAHMKHQPIFFRQRTGTPLDPLLLEVNRLTDKAFEGKADAGSPRGS